MPTQRVEADHAAELSLGIACQRAGDPARALAALGRAAVPEAPRAIAAQAHMRAAVVHRNQMNYPQALRHAQAAHEAATEAAEPALLLEARNIEGSIWLAKRDFPRAEAVFRALLAEAGDADDAATMKVWGLALANLGTIHAEQGRYTEARPLYTAAHDAFRLAGYVFGIPLALQNIGRTCLDLGDHDVALGYLIEARDAAVQVGDLELASLASLNIGEAVAHGGEAERAVQYVSEAIGGFAAAGNRSRHCYALGVFALAAELGGDMSGALAAYEAGMRRAQEIGLGYLMERYTREIARLRAA
jgi:tetratricopeptide (TPR) repeat protein